MSGPQRTPVRAALRMSWRAVELSFAEDTIQTRMARWAPHRLVVPYTRGMLAALWLQPRPQCIGIIGLGGGAQAKFCRRYLPWARVEAVEADPQVLALKALSLIHI